MSQARRLAERRGQRGEAVAALWLRLFGWRLVARRVRVRVGEIDLIMRRRRMLAFIEVKARRRAAELDLAIDAHRLRRVAAAVNAVAHRYARPGDDLRIDVVLIAPWRWPRHLTTVWP